MILPNGKLFFDAVGGRPTLEKVHKIFYDKVYADPWIGQFFKEIDQKLIENQQTDFMAQRMGGPKDYMGKLPLPAHKHMFISEELFDHRHQMLKASLIEAGLDEDLIVAWMNVDDAFRRAIVKKSLDECQTRYVDEPILNFDKPKKAA